MRYTDPVLRDKLASEYVLGTLRGAARARFHSLLKYDPDLRVQVAQWETKLVPLTLAARDIQPPARVWERIAARIAGTTGTRARTGWWASLALWRGFAVAGAVAAVALGITLRSVPAPEPQVAMVAVMSDEQARPAVVVSWPPQKAAANPQLRVRIVTPHATMPDNTSWELWMLPGGDQAPVSLGLMLSLDEIQMLPLRRELAGKVGQAWGIALSVEPRGGSPTGKPTGPVIMKGQCVRLR